MLKIFRKISLIFYFVIFTLVTVYTLVQNLKLTGFKRALSDLVEKETHHQYTIEIGDSDIDIFNLNFVLRDVFVHKIDTSDRSGIQAVYIPYTQVKINSLQSYFRQQQFDIRNLTIQEPQVKVYANPQKVDYEGRITEQLLKLYPPIESIFERFNISNLTILKGSLKVQRQTDNLISLNLIDLFFHDWNMRQLTDKSQFQLTIGQQQLNFNNTSLSFSAVNYNFPGHRLIFDDYRVTTEDSSSASHIEVSGKNFIVKSLDYEELFNNHRYNIRSVELDNPIVSGALKIRGVTKNIDERSVVTRILKQLIGECKIDSTIVRHAELQLQLKTTTDSVGINLPRVDILVQRFSVSNDTSSFRVGAMEIGVDSTSILLNNNLQIRCARVAFDDRSNLKVTEARFYESTGLKPFITCRTIQLSQFNLIAFAFYKQIVAQSLSINQAAITGSPHLIKFFDRKRSITQSGTRLELSVRRTWFDNVSLDFKDDNNTLSLQTASGTIGPITKTSEGPIELELQSLRAGTVEFTQQSSKTQVEGANFSFDRGAYSIERLSGRSDSLQFQLAEVEAQNNSKSFFGNPESWELIHISRVRLGGRLSVKDGTGEKSRGNINVAFLQIENLVLNLERANTRWQARGKNLSWKHPSLDSPLSEPSSLQGSFYFLNYHTPSFHLQTDSLIVRGDKWIAYQGKAQGNAWNLQSKRLHIGGLQQNGREVSVEMLSCYEPLIKKGDQVFQSDSLSLKLLNWSAVSGPTADACIVFRPHIQMHLNEAPDQPSAKKKSALILTHLTLTAGQVLFNHQLFETGLVDISFKPQVQIACSSLSHHTPTFDYVIQGLKYSEQKLALESFEMVPNIIAFNQRNIQGDLISFVVKGIEATGFNPNLHSTGSVRVEQLNLNQFILKVSRDKQMPSPPVVDKPYLLEKLLRPPVGVNVHHILFENGFIGYRERAAENGQEGEIEINQVKGSLTYAWPGDTSSFTAQASGLLYNQGKIELSYASTQSQSFHLGVDLKKFDLTRLNRVIKPLQTVEIKSGYLDEYTMQIDGDHIQATGKATLSYHDLHLDLFRKNQKQKKSGFITFVADKFFLKNGKQQVVVDILQPRPTSKSVFNYWIKSAMNGALDAVKHGKEVKSQNDEIGR